MPNVTALRTIRLAERANLLWLEVETDEGLTGLGESCRAAKSTSSACSTASRSSISLCL